MKVFQKYKTENSWKGEEATVFIYLFIFNFLAKMDISHYLLYFIPCDMGFEHPTYSVDDMILHSSSECQLPKKLESGKEESKMSKTREETYQDSHYPPKKNTIH